MSNGPRRVSAASMLVLAPALLGLDVVKNYRPPTDEELEAARESLKKRTHYPAAAGRNDPCPCRSGHKYKKCCIGKALYSGRKFNEGSNAPPATDLRSGPPSSAQVGGGTGAKETLPQSEAAPA